MKSIIQRDSANIPTKRNTILLFLFILYVFNLNILTFGQSCHNGQRNLGLEFPTITFIPYSPIDNTSSIHVLYEYINSVEKIHDEIDNKYLSFCVLLGNIQANLYQDKALLTWYNAFKDSIFSDIQYNYNIGNYIAVSQLINEKTNMIQNDIKLLCRLEASYNYKTFRDNIRRNNSGIRAQWWLEEHPFYYQDCFNELGEFCGYMSTKIEYPLDEFSWYEHSLFIRKKILTNTSYSMDICGNLYDEFCNEIDFRQAVEESFKFELWYYNNEIQSSHSPSASSWLYTKKGLLFDGENIVSTREYYIRMLSSFLLR